MIDSLETKSKMKLEKHEESINKLNHYKYHNIGKRAVIIEKQSDPNFLLPNPSSSSLSCKLVTVEL